MKLTKRKDGHYLLEEKMEKNKAICILIIVFLVITCFAAGGKDWLKWQESLDLARPEDLASGITIEKSIISEGEPLLISCFIKNITTKDATVILPVYNRIAALFTLTAEFSIKTSNGVEYWYRTNVHIDVGLSPSSERIIMPNDSIYINAILWPDNFTEIKKLHPKRGLNPGDHTISCTILLGAKFYPKPGRTLVITSDTKMVTMKQISIDDQKNLSAVKNIMTEFFGYGEGEDVSDSCRHLAYPLLNEIRDSYSYLAPYANFVYISMLAYDRYKNRLDEAITKAREFIKNHQGTILGEEMEFLLVKMLYQKEGICERFVEEAQRVIITYPKNINSIEIQYLLEEK